MTDHIIVGASLVTGLDLEKMIHPLVKDGHIGVAESITDNVNKQATVLKVVLIGDGHIDVGKNIVHDAVLMVIVLKVKCVRNVVTEEDVNIKMVVLC